MSCANDLGARLYLENMAARLKVPSIQACAQDGRTALGGIVSLFRPKGPLACFGCLFPARPRLSRGELLLPTVTRTIANVAAHLAVDSPVWGASRTEPPYPRPERLHHRAADGSRASRLPHLRAKEGLKTPMSFLTEVLWAASVLLFLAGCLSYMFSPRLGAKLFKRSAILLAVLVIGPSLMSTAMSQISPFDLVLTGAAASLAAYLYLTISGKAGRREPPQKGASFSERQPKLPPSPRQDEEQE